MNFNGFGYSPSGQIIVTGDGEAAAYMMAANSFVTMRSRDGKYVYFRQTDAYGQTISFEKYRLSKDEEPEKKDYITRQEFDEFVRRMKTGREENDHA